MYKIVRFYANSSKRTVVCANLTKEEAVAHCQDIESSSSTCTTPTGNKRTQRNGPWFDGFEED